jgi:hypothetical protein
VGLPELRVARSSRSRPTRASTSTCWRCRWTTRTPTRCSAAATPWASSSSTAARCAPCCA